jgi:hypothetical protein
MAEYYRKSGYKVPPETAAALAAAIGAADRRRLFLLPPEATAAIVWTRRERTAYGLLMSNLDAPPPRDLYSVPENPFVRDFLSALFPEKGYLPTPVLDAARARLPD